jgi:peptidoglycan hydrolase-like protein with peptidoglycan-binding domain
MGTGRPRSLACALAALALISSVAPATPASAKAKHGKAYPFGSRLLSPGSKGKDVRYLQRALTRLGVPTGIDGAFGKGTYLSVKTFERQRGWPVDGRVSKKDAKKIKKLLMKRRVTAGYFVLGYVNPTMNLSSKRAGVAKVNVMDASGNAIASIQADFSGPETRGISWNGTTATTVAPDGTYQLKLADPGTAKAEVSGGQVAPFGMHLHPFPVPGTHNFGGPDSRFGAPRAGHTHQGQDVAAACGERLYVAETGSVETNAYQATGAGYYVVIHGNITGTDSVYMHLMTASWAPVGAPVYAGQQIGKVGDTGDAQGCHLHFERWTAPGWYVGGAPYDPLPELLYWDSYS